jgi:preprotein translocase subunit YajC
MIDVLFAQQGQPPGGGGLFGDPNMVLLWMVGLFFLMWFIVLRPMSKKQQREQQQMLASIKPGVKVVTTAGIVGKVVAAKEGEDEITIRSEDTRLRVLRSSILRVLGTEEAEAAKS